MRPTRAAWFFLAGVAWLVLRGILGRTVPQLDPLRVAEAGGAWLAVPLMSVAASFTVPLFFVSFLSHHDFQDQRPLRAATVLATLSSIVAFMLVVVSFLGVLGGTASGPARALASLPWLVEVVPLALVASLALFQAAFAWRSQCAVTLRRAAAAGAVGAMVPTVLIALWMVRVRVPGFALWWDGVVDSPVLRLLGLTAAAALVWFLESFAVSYGRASAEP